MLPAMILYWGLSVPGLGGTMEVTQTTHGPALRRVTAH